MGHANISVFVPHIGCPNQCSFCNQRSISGRQSAPTAQQVSQLCEEAIRLRQGNLKNTQLAFFGGSFTAIEPEYMTSLLEAAKPYIGEGGFSGIRISTRPDAISKEMLEFLKSYGVNAVELGIQSMSDKVLAANRRGHTAQDTVAATKMIQDAGIEFGAQMMTGLYQSSAQEDRNTARAIAALSPTTVRIYPTIVLEGTALAEYYRAGLYQPPSLEESVALCGELLEFFENRGIRVIRLGLHTQQSLEEGMVAGPYHPAFRELCEGEVYLRQAVRQTERFDAGKALNLFVHPKALSKMAGQNRRNLEKLKQRNPIKIKPDDMLPLFAVRAEAAE